MSLYYQDEHVTLYHGDCLTEHREWLDADVLVTDPPYGVNWRAGVTSYRAGGRKVYTAQKVASDEDTEVRDAALAAWADKPAIVFGSWRAPRPRNVEHRLIWHKKGQAPGPVKAPFMSQDEEIYVIGKGFLATSPPMRSVIPTTEARSQEVRAVGHPTPKPVSLMELLLARCPEGVVADPFAGSGATLLAAANLGRKAVGVELEEKYCEIIARRLAQGVLDFGGIA